MKTSGEAARRKRSDRELKLREEVCRDQLASIVNRCPKNVSRDASSGPNSRSCHGHLARLQMTPDLLHAASERFALYAMEPTMKDKSLLGPWIRRFLLEHLVAERNLSRNT